MPKGFSCLQPTFHSIFHLAVSKFLFTTVALENTVKPVTKQEKKRKRLKLCKAILFYGKLDMEKKASQKLDLWLRDEKK